jgi:uncharacterized protein (TIGR03435 family)
LTPFRSSLRRWEKQLGLKLDGTKIAVDTLVIDHVEKTPMAN